MKNILILTFCLLSVFLFSQTPIKKIRVSNATTAIGTNLVKGTEVFDIATNNLWIATAAITSSSTLTTAAGSFSLVNSSSGSSDFLSLDDTPNSYDNQYAADVRVSMSGDNLELVMEDDDSGGKPVSFTFLDRISDVGAAQGVASDGKFIYTTGYPEETGTHYWIMKWTKDGTLVTSRENAHLDGTDVDQVNGIHIKDGKLYVSSNNYPNTPKKSYVKIYDAADLSYIEEHQLKDYIAECATFHDGYWWSVYSEMMIVSKYNESWVWQADYNLTYSVSGTHKYQGLVWIDDYILCPIHAGSTPQTLDVYKWNGSGFDEVIRIDQINIGYTGQGIFKEPNKNILWWAERNYPSVYKNNVVKTRINYIVDGVTNSVTNGSKTASFSHDAENSSIGAYTLSTSNAVIISINNLKSGMQGTLFLDIATLPSSITVNTYSDVTTTGLTEVVLGATPDRASSKASSITYTCANDGTNTQVYLVYGQEE